MNYAKPITTKAAAETFLRELHATNKLFHPDDRAEQIINREGQRIFTDAEAALIDARMDEVHEQLADPCGFILENFHR